MRLSEITQPDRGPEPKPGDNAVFIKKDDKWILWCNFESAKTNAEQERDYLVNDLGVEAAIFVKK